MAKNGTGRLSKLRCILKRWNSSTSPCDKSGGDTWQRSASFGGGDEVGSGEHPVYVGKSRRRYLVSRRLMENPLFRNLLESESPAVVGCQVVLFEHMLWMLENADPKPDSLEDILDFYACS